MPHRRGSTLALLGRRRILVLGLATLLAPLAVRAQDSRGVGISGATLDDGTHVAYLREDSRTGATQNTRLVVAVLWRAPRDWDVASSAADGARVRAMMDSARAAATARGHTVAGTITPRGQAWVEYDRRTRTVLIGGNRLPIPGADSTMVVLVDGVHANAPMTMVVIPTTAHVDTIPATPNATRSDGILERHQDGQRRVLATPAVRDFLASTRRP